MLPGLCSGPDTRSPHGPQRGPNHRESNPASTVRAGRFVGQDSGAGQVLDGFTRGGSRGLPQYRSGAANVSSGLSGRSERVRDTGCRRSEQLAPAVLPGGTRWSVAMAGDVPDVFAGLTHSQICVHEPFKTVEINRGRHAMRALGERSVDLLITMNTHGRYPDCRRGKAYPAFQF